MTTTDLVLQPVPVMMDSMKILLVNVKLVESLVLLVITLGIVTVVLKTENTPQNVDVQSEPSIVVLLPVAHVLINVSPVKVLMITVLNVMISEPQLQFVVAQINTMKKKTEPVGLVLKNVSPVTLTLGIVIPVEESENSHQIVIVHLDIIED